MRWCDEQSRSKSHAGSGIIRAPLPSAVATRSLIAPDLSAIRYQKSAVPPPKYRGWCGGSESSSQGVERWLGSTSHGADHGADRTPKTDSRVAARSRRVHRSENRPVHLKRRCPESVLAEFHVFQLGILRRARSLKHGLDRLDPKGRHPEITPTFVESITRRDGVAIGAVFNPILGPGLEGINSSDSVA